ncbi:MAG: hypothetical protein Q8L48_35865 [Archangium sp.]|nr:hypothetical protein [Archangium sp.]
MLALLTALTLCAPVDLEAWNRERLQTSRVGMIVLGAWAVGNMGVGAFGFGLERDERLRFLHLGNLVWNAVNLGLALNTLIREWNENPAALDAKKSLEASEQLEKIFFINGALDLGYLAAAAFLWQRGEATGDQKLVGFGQALVIQGAFLVLFDLTMGILNARLTGRLLEGVTVSLTPIGLSARF